MSNKNKRELDIESLAGELLDKQKMSEYGIFAIKNDTMIATKIQDIIYPRILSNIDDEMIKAIILQACQRAKSGQFNKKIKSGTIFILPLTSIFALVNDSYLAVRIPLSNNEILFIHHNNRILDLSNENNTQFYGCSFAICGILSTKERKADGQSLFDKYEKSIQYLNDFITAYRLIKHDHNVKKETGQTLPSIISYAEARICRNKVRLKRKEATFHYHDLMDVRAKLLFDSEFIVGVFAEYCEKIPLNPDIRYVLDLFLDSMNEFCLGQYEKCVTDSDLFVDYSTKLIWSRIPNLSNKKIPNALYAKSGKESAIGMIAEELGIKGDAVVSKWASKSRKTRNDFIHQMKYSALNGKSTQEAMKYNFEIVAIFTKKLSLSDGDPLKLLMMCKEMYEHIFEK